MEAVAVEARGLSWLDSHTPTGLSGVPASQAWQEEGGGGGCSRRRCGRSPCLLLPVLAAMSTHNAFHGEHSSFAFLPSRLPGLMLPTPLLKLQRTRCAGCGSTPPASCSVTSSCSRCAPAAAPSRHPIFTVATLADGRQLNDGARRCLIARRASPRTPASPLAALPDGRSPACDACPCLPPVLAAAGAPADQPAAALQGCGGSGGGCAGACMRVWEEERTREAGSEANAVPAGLLVALHSNLPCGPAPSPCSAWRSCGCCLLRPAWAGSSRGWRRCGASSRTGKRSTGGWFVAEHGRDRL